jgi:hypothetical protein
MCILFAMRNRDGATPRDEEIGADGGSRTRTGSPPQDFKSCVSTSSTTSARAARRRQATVPEIVGRGNAVLTPLSLPRAGKSLVTTTSELTASPTVGLLALAERPHHLVAKRLEEVGERGAGPRLDEGLDRHSRNDLEILEPC